MPSAVKTPAETGATPCRAVSRPGLWSARLPGPGFFFSLFLVVLFWAVLFFFVVKGAGETEYFWQWFLLKRVFFTGPDGSFFSGPLWQGLTLTLLISGVSMCLSLVLAMFITAMRLGGGPVARWLALAYVQCVRNIPLLVFIFFIYFVIAPGLGMDALCSAIVALSLFTSAFMAEILRGGILSISITQWESALSLGLSPWTAARKVILPQAVRNALPPLLNQGVSLIKDSSLASVIAVTELTLQGRMTVSSTFMSLEIWITVAGVYLALCLLLSGLVRLVGRRLNRGWSTPA